MDFYGWFEGQGLYRCRECHGFVRDFDRSSHRCNHWIRETWLDRAVFEEQERRTEEAAGVIRLSTEIKEIRAQGPRKEKP